MTTVVEIPGVGEVEFPDGMSPADIELAIREMTEGEGPPAATQSAPGTLFDHAVTTFANNALGLPRGMGELIALGGAGAEKGASAIAGVDGPSFGELRETHKNLFPASMLRAIPAPTVQDIGAGMRSLPALFPGGDSFGERFDQSRAQIDSEREANASAHPIAAGAGDVAGDVATIFSGRAGPARGINKAENVLMHSAPSAMFSPNVAFVLDRTLLSKPMRTLARGAGRSVETGFEAAVLDAAKGDDPLETALFAAGGQAGGSLLLNAGKNLLSGGIGSAGLKLGMSALAIGSTLQLLKGVTPGGQNSIIDSVQSGYGKVTWTLALGALSGMAGAGRLRGGEWAERFPIMMDALSTVPRASVISLMEDWRDSGEATKGQMEVVINQLMKQPEYFGAAATEQLAQAMNGGRLSATIAGLMDNQEFRKRYDALHPFNGVKYKTGGAF